MTKSDVVRILLHDASTDYGVGTLERDAANIERSRYTPGQAHVTIKAGAEEQPLRDKAYWRKRAAGKPGVDQRLIADAVADGAARTGEPVPTEGEDFSKPAYVRQGDFQRAVARVQERLERMTGKVQQHFQDNPSHVYAGLLPVAGLAAGGMLRKKPKAGKGKGRRRFGEGLAVGTLAGAGTLAALAAADRISLARDLRRGVVPGSQTSGQATV